MDGMINVKIGKRLRQFPKDWNELNRQQLIGLVRIWSTVPEDATEMLIDIKRLETVKLFLNVSDLVFRKIRAFEFAELFPLVNWITEKPKVELNKQLIPYFWAGFRKYHGPKVGLNTSTFNEFIYCDTQFINYAEKKDEHFAYMLVAAMYRRERKDLREFMESPEWDGDVREPLVPSTVEARAKFLKRWMCPDTAKAIVYFYWGFRNTNLLTFKTLFKEPKEGAPAKKKNPLGWFETRLEISGGKFGNFKETGEANWRTIIVDMHLAEVRRQEQERQRKFNEIASKRKR
jgi:hypothetical protein